MNVIGRLTRLFGLVVIPVFGLVSPLLVIPAITSTFDANAWVAVALGQSVGGAASVVVELGWGLNGPQRVARQSPAISRLTMAMSVLSKFVVFVPVTIVAFFVAGGLSPAHQLESGLVAIGSAALGLSCSWFFIGTQRVGSLVLTDALPRMLCAAASAMLILLGAPLWTYAVLGLLLPSLLSVSLAITLNGVSYSHFRKFSFRRIIGLIVCQGSALSGRALSAMYIALPVTIVTLAAPAAAPVFAAAERLQRMYLQLLAAFPNMMQGWVGKPGTRVAKRSRINSAVLYNAGLGVVAGVAYSFMAPAVAAFVFSGVAPIPFEVACLGGVLIFFVSTSRATGGLALVSLRKIHVIAWSALAGSVIGVPAIFVLARYYGPAGGVLGEVIAELVVLCVQLVTFATSGKRDAQADRVDGTSAVNPITSRQ
ncbi:hypothetical protein [Pseudarthrobacter sp. NPDC057230]|uniref:hypothetical protein n=1 Tax=Pseudarthrobacter sp. NPDC057230 TaxID=3346057 RepID=UPI00362E9925